MIISKPIKHFIDEYGYLLNDPSQYIELTRIANEVLYNKDLINLFIILEDIGVDLTDYRWEIFDNTFMKELNYLKLSNKLTDPSDSWSRLQYMLGDVGYQGFTYKEIVDHLKKVKDILGIKMEPLEPEYGWEGPGDYNLGWFNREKFREEYPEDFDEE